MPFPLALPYRCGAVRDVARTPLRSPSTLTPDHGSTSCLPPPPPLPLRNYLDDCLLYACDGQFEDAIHPRNHRLTAPPSVWSRVLPSLNCPTRSHLSRGWVGVFSGVPCTPLPDDMYVWDQWAWGRFRWHFPLRSSREQNPSLLVGWGSGVLVVGAS